MAAKRYPVFNFEPCISCQVCAEACPVSCIELSIDGLKEGFDQWHNYYPDVDKTKCIGCSMCFNACPVEAIRMEEALGAAS